LFRHVSQLGVVAVAFLHGLNLSDMCRGSPAIARQTNDCPLTDLGLDPDVPGVGTGIDLVRWELSLVFGQDG
jgi:hypothetical protein